MGRWAATIWSESRRRDSAVTRGSYHGPRDGRPSAGGPIDPRDPPAVLTAISLTVLEPTSNGIGSDAQQAFMLTVNEAPASLDLTDSYTSAQDDYRQGTVRMPLADLPAGHNSVRVRAWDTFNNSATTEIHFEVSASDEALTLTDVFNYPNPFSHTGTSFTFRHNQHARALQARIKIYTVAGRLIQTLEGVVPAGEPFAKIAWDGRDRDGDILANGVYLYKLLVSTDDGRSTAEALGKLAVLR